MFSLLVNRDSARCCRFVVILSIFLLLYSLSPCRSLLTNENCVGNPNCLLDLDDGVSKDRPTDSLRLSGNFLDDFTRSVNAAMPKSSQHLIHHSSSFDSDPLRDKKT